MKILIQTEDREYARVKVMHEIKTYADLNEMFEDLLLRGLPADYIARAIAHEKSHFDRAVKAGLKAQYILVYADGDYHPSVRVEGMASDRDLREILSAPESLSEHDAERLRELGG